jgi:membrane-associated phospholipid phosphatase
MHTLFKPLIAFATVTIIRKLINRKRPYEYMNITPLVSHKKGQSFPSRHTLSAMIIAFVTLNINITLGIILVALASVIGICRILAGVHHISDVLVGAIYALFIYIII